MQKISIGLFLLQSVVLAMPAIGFAALTDSRSIDGSGNTTSDLGAANRPLLRITMPADYPDDGSGSTMIDASTRPNPRSLSNIVAVQSGTLPNQRSLTNYIWQWGQFVDHDIDLTETDPGNGTAMIAVVDANDPLAPGPIPFTRSNFDPTTGTPGNPRQQQNQITSFIDASNVYGSDATRAAALRTSAGTGARLATSANDLLPYNDGPVPLSNAGGPGSNLFLAGDVRSNEQIGLTAMHTLFVREHNRLVDRLVLQTPAAPEEELYQTARKIVGAEMQVITYREFLPALLGPYAPSLDTYGGYDPSVDPSISNEFSTALYRFGHSLLSSSMPLVENDGTSAGSVGLRDAFFNPDFISNEPMNVDRLLMGLSTEMAQEVDLRLVDDVRSFLFGPPGSGGMDLAALNIQRGRDHGLPDYNTVRAAFGLAPASGFSDISSDVAVQQALASAYQNDVNNVDVWVGALAEDHLLGASVGELIKTGLVNQFERLRDGDRFFFLNDPDLVGVEVADGLSLDDARLSDMIRLNSSMSNMQENVFLMVPEPSAGLLLLWGCAMVSLRRRF